MAYYHDTLPLMQLQIYRCTIVGTMNSRERFTRAAMEINTHPEI